MSEDLSMISDSESAFHAAFEFKGQELNPFSEGRRSVAASIGVRFSGSPEPTITDMHAVIFICLADSKLLAKAHRNPDMFWEKILEWVDANITQDDYAAEALLVKEILDSAFATRAEPIPEPGGQDAGN